MKSQLTALVRYADAHQKPVFDLCVDLPHWDVGHSAFSLERDEHPARKALGAHPGE